MSYSFACLFLVLGSDNLVVLWNVGTGEPTVVIESHPDLVYSACWNWDGSKLLTTCKDKKIRIINPRTGNIEEVSGRLISARALAHDNILFVSCV